VIFVADLRESNWLYFSDLRESNLFVCYKYVYVARYNWLANYSPRVISCGFVSLSARRGKHRSSSYFL